MPSARRLAPADVLLDCPVDVRLGREGAHRSPDRFEREAVATADPHGFLALAAAAPERILVIDSTEDPAAASDRILTAARARLEAAA
jgi:thymidylate kinase